MLAFGCGLALSIFPCSRLYFCYSCYFFLWSNKVTTKNSELKRKGLENAKNFGSAYSADIRVSFSVSLRIVCGFFPCDFSASLSDAEAGEDGGEDVGGGDGAGDGGEVVDGLADVLGDEVGGQGGGQAGDCAA